MSRLSIAFMVALLTMTAGERPGEDHKFGALNVHGDGSEGTKAIGGETGVTIRFLLTRHALSCANAVKYFTNTETAWSVYHARVHDPLLTECGAHRSSELKIETRDLKPDYVLSSHLLRAMQTAALMYDDIPDGRKVTPVPWISEKGWGYDNARLGIDEQKKQLSKLTTIPVDAINWTWMGNDAYEQTTLPNWGNFLKFMVSKFLPEVPNLPTRKDLTIAVVTHSGLMKSVLKWVDEEIAKRDGAAKGPCAKAFGLENKKDEPKLKNNQVVSVVFDYNPTGAGTFGTLSPQGGCEKLFDDKIKDQPAKLCERDAICLDAHDWIEKDKTTEAEGCCVPKEEKK